jgi:hypothetical protein
MDVSSHTLLHNSPIQPFLCQKALSPQIIQLHHMYLRKDTSPKLPLKTLVLSGNCTDLLFSRCVVLSSSPKLPLKTLVLSSHYCKSMVSCLIFYWCSWTSFLNLCMENGSDASSVISGCGIDINYASQHCGI